MTNRVRAVSAWFFLNGFVVASWIAHVPRLKEELRATPGPLGLALLCMALGSVAGMALAPWAAGRVGPGRAAWLSGVVFTLLLPLPLAAGSVAGLGLALLAFGAAHGLMDVTMNAEAAATETALGRPVMSSFHGWFSVGMVLGVLGGVGALAAGWRPFGHAAAVAGFAAGLFALSRPTAAPAPPASEGGRGWSAVRDRRVVALAAVAFVCLFLEGAMADWSGLLAAGYGASAATAPLAYVAFTATWAAGRFVGDRLTRALGDVALARAGGVLAAAGMLGGVLSEAPAGVAVGCAVVGLGLANVVPVLFRAAAAADPTGRGAGLAAVTGVGYTGFLVGPPAIGFLAEAVGLPGAMGLVVMGGVTLALAAGVLRRAEPGA